MRNEHISDFFRSLEVPHEDFLLSVRFAHVLVHEQNLKAVTYSEEGGLVDFLQYLTRLGWEGIYENDYLIGAKKDNTRISLGMGGQVYWHMEDFLSIRSLEQNYLGFIESLFEELKRRGQILLAIGHQPVSTAGDIPSLPLARYKAKEQYAQKNFGLLDYYKCAATNEISLQFAHADNFQKRFQAAIIAYPALAAVFDNTPWVEGEAIPGPLYNINHILETDKALYHLEHALADEFKYEEYADFVMQAPAMYAHTKDGILEKAAESVEEVYTDALEGDALLDALHNVEPMVSVTEKGITLKHLDSVPYPLNIAMVLMVKALLYKPDHMTALQKMIEEQKAEKLIEARKIWREKGFEAPIAEGTFFDMFKDLFFMINLTVEPSEQHYLQAFTPILFQGVQTRHVTDKQLQNMSH